MRPRDRASNPIPWIEIRDRYVRSPDAPVVARLAREYQISATMLYKRIAKEGWDDARQAAQIEGARDLRRVANLALRGIGPEIREHLQERLTQIRRVNGELLDEISRGLGSGVVLEGREDEIVQTTDEKGRITKKATLRRGRPAPDPHLVTSLLRMELETLLALADAEERDAADSDMAGTDASPAPPGAPRPSIIQIH